jgi:ribonuclease HI
MTTKKRFYAYALPDGRQGVVDNWPACDSIVSGVKDARYKAFASLDEANAWLAAGAEYGRNEALEPGIYFDAGTGRGDGVEVSVTDEKGDSLLDRILPVNQINRYGKHRLRGDVTNNYGELLACSFALQIALKTGVKKIFGDSKLILDYWSKGYIKSREAAPETVQLARSVVKLRKEFEDNGAKLEYVSGEDNPADLGFHK